MVKDEKVSAEQTVRDIRRQTRRKYNTEEKIRIVVEGLRGKQVWPSCVAAKALTPTCTTSGAKSFWKREKPALPEIQNVKRQAMRSVRFDVLGGSKAAFSRASGSTPLQE